MDIRPSGAGCHWEWKMYEIQFHPADIRKQVRYYFLSRRGFRWLVSAAGVARSDPPDRHRSRASRRAGTVSDRTSSHPLATARNPTRGPRGADPGPRPAGTRGRFGTSFTASNEPDPRFSSRDPRASAVTRKSANRISRFPRPGKPSGADSSSTPTPRPF